MAIVRMFDAKGWTTAGYDELMNHLVARLGLPPGKAAPGVLFHWAGATADGVRAVDVYESRESADRLVAESIGPIAHELGLPLPEITEFEVHQYLAA
jgi:hypothetical protein